VYLLPSPVSHHRMDYKTFTLAAVTCLVSSFHGSQTSPIT